MKSTILRMLRERIPDKEIAQRVGCCPRYVQNIRKAVGIPAQFRRHWTAEQWETAKRMQAEGHTYKQIGLAVDKSENTVRAKFFREGYGGESAQDRHRVERESKALVLLSQGIRGRKLAQALGCCESQAWKYKVRLTPLLKGSNR